MLASRFAPLAAIVILGGAGPARADISRAVLERCKRASALLIVGKEDQATAFSVGRGFFVTASHAVSGAPVDAQYRLVLEPGEASQQVLDAKLVRADDDLDVALLRVEESKAPPALALAWEAPQLETTPVTAFGYPFGKGLALGKDEYPNITVSMGRITSVRKLAGRVEWLQLDASLNPGNSGGAVVTDDGKVVGIVAAGVPGTALNFAVPVDLIARFMYGPPIRVTGPALTAKGLADPRTYQIDARAFAKKGQTDKVTMSLSAFETDRREYAAEDLGDGKFRVQAPPAPVANPYRLMITVDDGITKETFPAVDRTITVGGDTIRLSAIKELTHTGDWRVLLGSGTAHEGALTGLEGGEPSGAPGRLAGALGKPVRITIATVDSVPSSVRYVLSVRRGQEVVARQEGAITAEGILPDILSGEEKTGSWAQEPGASNPCIAYEGFEYGTGLKVAGQNGGTGWNGAWWEHGPGTSPIIVWPGLTYGRLRTSGGCLETTSAGPIGMPRKPVVALGTPGTTVWVSYLMRALDRIDPSSQSQYFLFTSPQVWVGKPMDSADLGIERANRGWFVASGTPAREGVTHFLVIRFSFSERGTNVDLYVNPEPGTPLPSLPSATKRDLPQFTLNELSFGTAGRCQFDELRVGYRYADVAPVK